MKNLKEFVPLLKLLKTEKKKLVFASILLFVGSLSSILTGYLNGAAVESITNLDIKMAITYLFIYFCIEMTADGTVIHYANSILYRIESILTRKLSFEAYKKALALPAYAYEKTSSGEIINRITADTGVLSFSFGRLLNCFTSLLGSLVIIVYIFINSWIVGLEIVIIISLLYLVIRHYNPIMENNHKARKKDQDKLTSLVSESVRGIREIRSLGIGNNLINNASDIIKLIFKSSKEEIDVEMRFNILTNFLKTTLEVGVFITCVILLYYKQISLTFFIGMTYYVYRYLWLIENLNDLSKTYQKTMVSIRRVNEILENRLYPDMVYGNKNVKNIKGEIEFKNVTFGYPNEGVLLNNFNLKLESNKKIAIIGTSGSGKSTLFNLLTRIFDTTKGEVLIDGINVKDFTEESLRRHVGIIRQEPFLFNRTIKENFEVLDKKVKLKDIREYCKMACIDDYIMSLPKKYNTLLGEGGVNLSGGQKQRLSIARTLMKNSKIILLDEATSALDNESQEYIKKSIDLLASNHTVVIVAHRLSTIIDADIIYVVKDGRILVSGTHEELLHSSKFYQKLYTSKELVE